MANSAQARKRARQAEKHRSHNASQRSTMRTAIKSVLAATRSGDKSAANDAFRKATPLIDRAARRGLIHKNAAARFKSRLNRRIAAIA